MENTKNRYFNVIFGLIGFTATSVQIIILREFLAIFHGNEISIGIIFANWLFWTSIGSYAAGKFLGQIKHNITIMAFLQLILSLIIPLTVIFIRISSPIVKSVPGEILGFLPMFLISFLVLSIFCLISGGLFAVASTIILGNQKNLYSAATGRIYLLESIGSALAGLILSFLMINFFNSLTICVFISFLNILAASLLSSEDMRKSTKTIIRISGIFLILLFLFSAKTIDSKTEAIQWQKFTYIQSFQSKYGKLALIKTGTDQTLYSNGIPIFTNPNKEAAEEAVHFALLQHPNPLKVLMIGGGGAEPFIEILKHPSLELIDYVELDPTIINISKNYFSESWEKIEGNSKVNIHFLDGRLYLKKSNQKFDIILVKLPDPQTTQLNRFYTEEFFELTKQKLKVNGLLSFQTQASENYINETLAQYLQSIYKTLSNVFPHTTFIPGNTVHFFASSSAGVLTQNSQTLIQRLIDRKIETQYVREYYFPFRMSEERIQYFSELVKPVAETPINQDFFPIAYYFNMVLWSTQFSQNFKEFVLWIEKLPFNKIIVLLTALLFTLIILFRQYSSNQKYLRFVGGISVMCMGFSVMGIEILALLVFQVLQGYVYHQLAILIASFMAGMALGSWLSIRNQRIDSPQKSISLLIIIHSGLALAAIMLPYAFAKLNRLEGVLNFDYLFPLLFTIFIFIVGGLGGYQFPLAGFLFYGDKANRQNAGTFYSFDL